mmetsp:Transcript_7835/g.20050  ORF Transcript_7835/g.20050 Transcript_7835/m.20050 type:complete len:436 (-) Transcript_7835:723-2030(-)
MRRRRRRRRWRLRRTRRVSNGRSIVRSCAEEGARSEAAVDRCMLDVGTRLVLGRVRRRTWRTVCLAQCRIGASRAGSPRSHASPDRREGSGRSQRARERSDSWDRVEPPRAELGHELDELRRLAVARLRGEVEPELGAEHRAEPAVGDPPVAQHHGHDVLLELVRILGLGAARLGFLVLPRDADEHHRGVLDGARHGLEARAAHVALVDPRRVPCRLQLPPDAMCLRLLRVAVRDHHVPTPAAKARTSTTATGSRAWVRCPLVQVVVRDKRTAPAVGSGWAELRELSRTEASECALADRGRRGGLGDRLAEQRAATHGDAILRGRSSPSAPARVPASARPPEHFCAPLGALQCTHHQAAARAGALRWRPRRSVLGEWRRVAHRRAQRPTWGWCRRRPGTLSEGAAAFSSLGPVAYGPVESVPAVRLGGLIPNLAG